MPFCVANQAVKIDLLVRLRYFKREAIKQIIASRKKKKYTTSLLYSWDVGVVERHLPMALANKKDILNVLFSCSYPDPASGQVLIYAAQCDQIGRFIGPWATF